MSEPTVSVSPPPAASSAPSASAPPPELSLLSSLVVLELELLLPPPQPATTSAAIARRSAAKSAAGRILVIRVVPPFGLGRPEHMAARPPCSSLHVVFCLSGAMVRCEAAPQIAPRKVCSERRSGCVHPGPIRAA